MRLFVDGIIFTFQKKGGISRIFSETLPLMCACDRSLDVTLLAQGCDQHILPKHEHIVVVPDKEWSSQGGILGKLLRKVQRYLYLSNLSIKDPTVWYSSYYTLPVKWQGPVVLLVADLIHELYPDLFNGTRNEEFRRRKRHCITQADAVICISEATRRDLVDFYKIDLKKTHVALLASGEVFKPGIQEQQKHPGLRERPFLFYIGTRVHYKNYGFFVSVYAQWSRNKEVDIVLIGPPLNRNEENILKLLNIASQVHVLNMVDDEQLCALYNQAAAFIYPSIYEGFGIPLLEAMACGCPVVASDIPSSREIAKDVPYYFSCHDREGFMHALDQAMGKRDPVRIGRGKELSRTYTWERTARQTLDILKTVSKG